MPILTVGPGARLSLPHTPDALSTTCCPWGQLTLSSPPCPHLLPLPHPQPLHFPGPVTFQKGSGVGAGWELSRVSESKLMSSLGLLLLPGLEGAG